MSKTSIGKNGARKSPELFHNNLIKRPLQFNSSLGERQSYTVS